MATLIILWVLFSIAEAYEDSQYTFILNHNPTVWPRLVTGLIVIWCWQYWPLTWMHLRLAFMLACIFWFVFELAGNLFSERYFFYIGTTSKWDRALKRWELPVFWFRMWLMGLSICVYFYEEILNTI